MLAANNLHVLCDYALEMEAASVQTDQLKKQQMQDALEQRKIKNRRSAEKHRQKTRDIAAEKDQRIKALEHDVYLLEHAIGMMYAINSHMKRARFENPLPKDDKMHIDYITHKECCHMGWLFHTDPTQTENSVYTYDVELAVRAASETMSFQKRRR